MQTFKERIVEDTLKRINKRLSEMYKQGRFDMRMDIESRLPKTKPMRDIKSTGYNSCINKVINVIRNV